MKIAGFVKGDRFFTLRYDAPNRRVTSITGKIGSDNPRFTRRLFNDRESLYSYVEQKIDTKIANGFLQIAG
jgi:hypothetical protein